MYIWMKVTADDLQLPLAVADTAQELADLCGTTSNNITSTVSHWKAGRIKNPSYVCVEVKKDDL